MSFPIFDRGVKLADHTTFRIGGPAAAFHTARSAEDVVDAASKAEGMGLPWQVIGHGSNILASDHGYNGAVISFQDQTPPALNADGSVTVSGGYPLKDLVQFYAASGLSGLEDLAGIPGTVGGAIAGNAGAYGSSIGALVSSALIMDRNGSMLRADRDDLIFSYRNSSIRAAGEVVLTATLTAVPDDPAAIAARIEERMADRMRKHPDPSSIGTAGSYFRNPVGSDGQRVAAGTLLEKAGCKELSIGGARLWQSHANIIVTDGKARASDVLALADAMADKVHEMWTIRLTPEVVYLG